MSYMKRNKIGQLASMVVILCGVIKIYKKEEKKLEVHQLENKILQYYDILNQWLRLKQEGISLSEYFVNRQWKSVAIYGIKELGERLYDELRCSDVDVKYFIDKRQNASHEEVDVVSPDARLSQVDVIVVTAAYYFKSIEKELKKKVNCPIISIEDIVYAVK